MSWEQSSPPRTGRWLIAVVVMIAALGLLLPLAVESLRALVALSN